MVGNRHGGTVDEESRRCVVNGEYRGCAVDGCQWSFSTGGEREFDKENERNGIGSRSGEIGGKIHGRKESDYVNGRKGR
jgi:hypothetical protein